jgi:DNA-binding response OmpR family regulator
MNEPESLHEHTVLIIEDQPDVARAMARALNPNFNVRIAPDAEQGFEELMRVRIDLVLLDVCLPDRSGLEFCEAVKSDLDLRHLPIIMVSGLRSLEDKVRGLETGSDDAQAKPFFVEELRSRVADAIQKSGSVEGESLEEGPVLPDTVHFFAEAGTIDLDININLN